MKFKIIYLAIVLIAFSSCSKRLTYFTEELPDRYNWSEKELKRIQFYVSEDIELYRTGSSGSTQIKEGQIQVKSARKTDKIVIKKGTPGTLINMPKDDRYAVSFDDSGDFLMFGPTKKNDGKFTLLAKEWKSRRGGGLVSYGSSEYRVSSEAAYAALMVDMKKANTSNTRSKTASGRKVN